MKKLYIRADGNSVIGTGHIMRCISIAEEYQRRGGECIFIVADESSESLLKGKDFPVIRLDSVWNDLNQETERMVQLIRKEEIQLLLIDTYFVTERYLETLKRYTKTAYIDDLEKFAYPVDFLINYSIYADQKDYDKLYAHADQKLVFLLGTEYAPLRNEFSDCSEKNINTVKNVLVSTGGTDSYHVALHLVKYLKDRNLFQNIRFHIAVGVMNSDYELIKNISSDMSNVILYHPAKDMFGLMNLCDVAISAAGTTLYELCAAGVPVITYILADNQMKAADSFVKKGVMLYGKDIRKEQDYSSGIFNCLEILKENPTDLKQISRNCQNMVDGKGCERIVDRLIGLTLR